MGQCGAQHATARNSLSVKTEILNDNTEVILYLVLVAIKTSC